MYVEHYETLINVIKIEVNREIYYFHGSEDSTLLIILTPSYRFILITIKIPPGKKQFGSTLKI